MRGQMNDAGRITQPAKGYTELYPENTARPEPIINPGSTSVETAVLCALGERSQNALFIWDIGDGPTFTLRYANPAFMRMVGGTPYDIIGKGLEEIIPHDACAFIYSRFVECANHQRDEEFIHEQFGCTLITRLCPQVEHGHTVRLIGTHFDITQYMYEQNRLIIANEQLRQQVLLLGTRLKFESLIAHALREFADSGCAGFDGALCGLNRGFGSLMEADQAFVLQRQSDALCIHKARWTRDGSWLCPNIGCIRSASDNSSLFQHNHLLVINDTRHDTLSPYSQELHRYGINALLAVPISRDAIDYGLLCLTQTTEQRIWTTAEISMAKTAADTIMSAYLRTRLEHALCENVRILTEYDEALQDLLTQKEVFTEISVNFLRAGSGGFTDSAVKALGNIGRLLDLDGLHVMINTASGLNAYGWCEHGLPRRTGREGWINDMALHPAFLRAPVTIADTAEARAMPEPAAAAAEDGVRSLLTVPLSVAEGITGVVIGYKMIGVRLWMPSDVPTMEAFARIFFDAYRISGLRGSSTSSVSDE